MLGGELAVLQAPMLDGPAFDTRPLSEDTDPAEVDVGRALSTQVHRLVSWAEEQLNASFSQATKPFPLLQLVA
jgi:hypothetical protein